RAGVLRRREAGPARGAALVAVLLPDRVADVAVVRRRRTDLVPADRGPGVAEPVRAAREPEGRRVRGAPDPADREDRRAGVQRAAIASERAVRTVTTPLGS